jgi:acyl carrier protein
MDSNKNSDEVSKVQARIDECFRSTFSKNFSDKDLAELKFKESREWDSVSHIRLMAALRDSFSIKFSFQDMVKMISYKEVIELISNKYNEQELL